MKDWTDNDPHVNAILTEVQNLDEIGGSTNMNHYMAVLEFVKADIEGRLNTAKKIMSKDETKMTWEELSDYAIHLGVTINLNKESYSREELIQVVRDLKEGKDG